VELGLHSPMCYNRVHKHYFTFGMVDWSRMFQTLAGFPAAEACVSSCRWQDGTMEHSAKQARFGLSLSLILTAGGGPSSAGREVGERITPYVIMTQNVTDGPTYCLV